MSIIPHLSKREQHPITNKLPQGFSYINEIDPTILISIKYASKDNFTGQPVKGYKKPVAIGSTTLAYALKNAQDILRSLGYSLVVYDAYRPQKSVEDFVEWTKIPESNLTKSTFYPFLEKANFVSDGYIAPRSGHTRGSQVDVTLIKLNKSLTKVVYTPYVLNNRKSLLLMDDGTVFMGGHFDLFDESSCHDSELIDEEATYNRNLLRNVMKAVGFAELSSEWWHYSLIDEPFPRTSFNFDVK